MQLDCHVVALSTACMILTMILARVSATHERAAKDALPLLFRLLKWQQIVLDGPDIQQRQLQQLSSQTITTTTTPAALSASPASTRLSQPAPSALTNPVAANTRASIAPAPTPSTTPRSSIVNYSPSGVELPPLRIDEAAITNRASLGSMTVSSSSSWIVLGKSA